MDASEFSKAPRVIRWSFIEGAGQLNLADSTIRKMAAGHSKMPKDIAVWLRAFTDDVAAARNRHPPPRRGGRPGP